MKGRTWVLVAILLAAMSALLHYTHYLIFHDAHHVFIYMFGDIAFLPMEVLLVTLIIDRLLSRREEVSRRNKMNMVIGAFFSEVGQDLILALDRTSSDADQIRANLAITPESSETDIKLSIAWAETTPFKIKPTPEVLADIRDHLAKHRDFMLRMLENPTLLEHETFTDLLWSVLHLQEELVARKSLDTLPETDLHHLAGDVERAYTHVLRAWLDYMIHLKRSYPFLFSLAARTNPLRPDARPEVV